MTVGAWDVAFMPARRPRHVLAYGFDAGAGSWVVIDPCLRRVAVQVMTPAQFDRWRAKLVEWQAPDIWRLDAQDGFGPPLPALWCVSTVKRLLGLRSGAFLPSGLRRDMRRAGAARLVTSRESQSPRRGSGRESRAAGGTDAR